MPFVRPDEEIIEIYGSSLYLAKDGWLDLRFSKNADMKMDFDPRVPLFCRFGCSKFRNKPNCPPTIPDIGRYREALKGYERALVYGRKYPFNDGMFSEHWRTYSTNEIHHKLLAREMELFSQGYLYAKAFIGGSCKLCREDACCVERCNIPHRGRASLEATGINVFSLLRDLGEEYQDPPREYFWRIGIVFF
jgi:predicted metal-binding protein